MRATPFTIVCASLLFVGSLQISAATQPPDMPYGKLHFEGSPAGHEYFRATFGGLINCASRPMVIANVSLATLDLVSSFYSNFNTSSHVGCWPYAPEDGVAGAFVVVWRGTCSFVQKALMAQEAGAAGVIVVNNEGGLVRMPMGNLTDGARVAIPVVMVRNATGPLLTTALRNHQSRERAQPFLSATLVPTKLLCVADNVTTTATIYDVASDGTAQLTNVTQQVKVTASPADVETGMLTFTATQASLPAAAPSKPVEFASASFSGPFATGYSFKLAASPTHGALGCEHYANVTDTDFTGLTVVVARGNCTMIDKARFAQDAGAVGLLIIGNAPEAAPAAVAAAHPELDLSHYFGSQIGAVQAVNDERNPIVVIPTFMVSYATGAWLLPALATGVQVNATIASQSAVVGSGDAWERLTKARDEGASYWPPNAATRQATLIQLIKAHSPLFAGSEERFGFLRTLCALNNLTQELGQILSTPSLLGEPQTDAPVKSAQPDKPVSPFSLPLFPVGSLISRALPASFLQLDDNMFVDCRTSFRHYHVQVPQFEPENPYPIEKSLIDLIRMQACVERVAMHVASSVGKAVKQFEFERGNSLNAKVFLGRLFGLYAVDTPERIDAVLSAFKTWDSIFEALLAGDETTQLSSLLV